MRTAAGSADDSYRGEAKFAGVRSDGGSVWVFGYGSLVSPSSLSTTLGRSVRPGDGWAEATLRGWGRRWNYGIGHVAGTILDESGSELEVTIVALGVVAAAGEYANGIVVAVDADELTRLDRRERHYDRVDVTSTVEIHPATRHDGAGRAAWPGPSDVVVTYVPRPEAVQRYESARDRGCAAIEQRYWDLVDEAFAALGPDRQATYRATTPAPDVPVRAVRRRS